MTKQQMNNDWKPAVGPDALLEEETRLEIYRRHRQGETIAQLAEQFGATVARVSNVLAQVRYERILQLALDHVPNDGFSQLTTEEERAVLGPAPAPGNVKKTPRPTGIPSYLASLYETPLLVREQEVHLFRKMNYLKYKAGRLREQLDPRSPSMARMQDIQKLHDQSVTVKNDIVRANLRLVVSIAKRYSSGPDRLFELISEGNMSLMRAAEKFDFARGFRFSTYASWAIMKNFARTIPAEQRYRARFHAGGSDEMLAATEDVRAEPVGLSSKGREQEIAKLLDYLDEREKQIIRYRFGLGPEHAPKTLKEVGAAMGVTKERIRQLEARAMAKLRDAARLERVEAPEA
jgi:RNA polymerase primary sigma factor/RNA polymerase sigma factor